MPSMVRNVGDQFSIGPNGVLAQSNARMRSAISPPPDKKLRGAVSSTVLPGSIINSCCMFYMPFGDALSTFKTAFRLSRCGGRPVDLRQSQLGLRLQVYIAR